MVVFGVVFGGFGRPAWADKLDEAFLEPGPMQALGLESWGPIAFGPTDLGGSEGLKKELPMAEWLTLETAHFRFASSLGAENLKTVDRARLEPYFVRLRAAGLKIPARPKKISPRVRLVLIAVRAEDLYARFLALIGHADGDFPAARQPEGEYLGNGRFLGEADKFEVLLHKSAQTHAMFCLDHMGAKVTGALRWHFRDPHKLFASVPASDSDLKKDRWLWPHIAHNLGHMFFAAYKHFSYQPPVWLDEGLALMLEREEEPLSITTEGEEGTLNEDVRSSDWKKELGKIAAKGEPRLATLFPKNTLGALSELEAASCWSRLVFLESQFPGELALFLGGVKGQLDAEGYPTGRDLVGLQRKLLSEHFGWSPADFDAAYFAWLPGFISGE